MVKSLHDAGANIMAGTDACNPFVLYGPALHDELAYYVDAGLTPYEAIRTATVAPARYLGKTDEFGSIAEGLRADFLLVDANPFEAIDNLQLISGVVLRGQWLARTELDEMRAAIIRLHATATAKSESDP
jgi:imidazolonepropionase-like amidohydrolase